MIIAFWDNLDHPSSSCHILTDLEKLIGVFLSNVIANVPKNVIY